MPEANNCPKSDCGKPESSNRWSAGKKLSVCGNGHSWDQAEVAAQRAKAREVDAQERTPTIDHLRLNLDMDHIRREFEKRYKGDFS